MECKFTYYKNCTTCKNAKKFLDAKQVKYIERDIKEDNPKFDEIKYLHEKSGLAIKKFFNTSGNLYKSMNLKDKVGDMSLEEAYTLLASDGMLVKRPILEIGDRVLLGFKQADWEESFL